MVSRASAVGCHPLREVPSLRRRGSSSISFRGRLPLAAAIGAWTLVAAAPCARLAHHAGILSPPHWL
jgi:hypothetical protein